MAVQALLWIALTVEAAWAGQAPTGTLSGLITDPSGGALPGVEVTAVNVDTGQSRIVVTSSDGIFSAPSLPSGSYRVTAGVNGFKRVERIAGVEAGTTTTVNVSLEVGDVVELVTVTATLPLLRYDSHQVGGVVTRDQIEQLPLNGRNFLELAKLEPGITNPVRLGDNRTFVSSLGAGLQTIPRVGYTRVTVDGVSLTTPATNGTLLQVSQDVVQEFQIATVNFDASTSLTTNGTINIVTRSGGNDFHGTGFSFYRDHHMAAYPALRHDPLNADLSFSRHQFGSSFGGPIRSNRVFFFASYERHDQHGLIEVRPIVPEFAPLGGIFPSPYLGNLFSGRIDARLSANHTAFARYTHEDNRADVGSATTLPSAWPRRTVNADQRVAGLTSVLSNRLVNDLRLSYFPVSMTIRPLTEDECRGCFGVGSPRITIADASNLTIGRGGVTSADESRFQFAESLVWQTRRQRLKFGFDWEHAVSSGSSINREPAYITVWSPGRVRQIDPTIALPASFSTIADVLQLPLRSFETGVGPGEIPEKNFAKARVQDVYRVYASTTWNTTPRMTVNAGLGWSYEPNPLNYDLTKPALLVPILGVNGLNPPAVQFANFSPTLGVAWMASRDGRTVVRGGLGRYFDPVGSTNALNLDRERLVLLPAGTGRLEKSGQNIQYNGTPLDFRQPTAFTAGQLLQILPEIRAALLRSYNADNRDFAWRNINVTKEGENLYDPSYATPSALHASVGLQRELAPGFVVQADFVWKRFVHTFINGIDYNRWNSVSGPVIPACASDAEKNDVAAVCSNGNIYFDTTIGRARYKGLLIRVEKRALPRAHVLASYALGSFVGSNGTGTGTTEAPGGRVFGFNNDDWFENYGPLPTDRRHVLNLSGFVEGPWHFQLALSVSAYSGTPSAPYIAGVDFNGDGTDDDLLPGTRVNQFGRGLGKADLAALVDSYNQRYANKVTVGGQTAPFITLPADYSFGDSFFTQDLRLTRTVSLGRRNTRMALHAEVFNLFNTANLTGHNSNLATTATFGQPTSRISQVAGSGGPRTFQFGARLSF